MVFLWSYMRMSVPTNVCLAVLVTTLWASSTLTSSKTVPLKMALTSSAGDVANIHQLLDAVERLVVFLAMHPERALSTNQGLGLAVALGAIKSRKQSSPIVKKFPPFLESRLSSLEHALGSVLASIRRRPQLSQLEAQLMQPQMWIFLPSPVTDIGLSTRSSHHVRSESMDDTKEDPGKNPEAVLLELSALLPSYSPTPKESDACLSELVVDNRCSRRCVGLATSATQSWGRPPASGYALTHRLLFLLTARQVGCVEIPLIYGQNAVHRLCSLMLAEAENISFLGYPELLKDIFVEQVTLCGLAGYREFLRPSWKSTLLDWQRPSGCFGNWTAEMISLEPFRSLAGTRADADLGGGCLAHLTDVATGALGVFLADLL